MTYSSCGCERECSASSAKWAGTNSGAVVIKRSARANSSKGTVVTCSSNSESRTRASVVWSWTRLTATSEHHSRCLTYPKSNSPGSAAPRRASSRASALAHQRSSTRAHRSSDRVIASFGNRAPSDSATGLPRPGAGQIARLRRRLTVDQFDDVDVGLETVLLAIGAANVGG
jgi:hypothetical protein